VRWGGIRKKMGRVRRRMFFLLVIVIIVRDVEEGFFWGGSSRKGVKRRKSTGATLVGERDGGAGGDVGHSEGREGHREKRGTSQVIISRLSGPRCPVPRSVPGTVRPRQCPNPLTSCPLRCTRLSTCPGLQPTPPLLHTLNTPPHSPLTFLSPMFNVKI